MTITAIHPGEHLAEELHELGMSASELARKLDVPPNRITAILNGQRGLTGDTALRLAHFFGVSAQFWLNLQNLYELRLAQQKAGKVIQALPRRKEPERIPPKQPALDRLPRRVDSAPLSWKVWDKSKSY
jgi:addiction module HigA family antidote